MEKNTQQVNFFMCPSLMCSMDLDQRMTELTVRALIQRFINLPDLDQINLMTIGIKWAYLESLVKLATYKDGSRQK